MGSTNIILGNAVNGGGTATTGQQTYAVLGSAFGADPPSGPLPTITLATPNVGSAAGGWTVVLTGTNFVSGASVSIGGAAATSVVVNSATQITCVAPAYSTANGTSTGQTISVTTTNGTGSGSGTPASYFYLPSNNTIQQYVRADVGVTTVSSKVSTWADQSGNSQNWTQSTGANQPAAPTGNFASTGLPYIAFNGTTSYMTAPAFPTAMTTATSFLIMALTNVVATQVFGIIGGGTPAGAVGSLYLYAVGGGYIGNDGVGGASYQIIQTVDALPHNYAFTNAKTKQEGGIDGSLTVTTPNSVALNNAGTTSYLGCYNSLVDFTAMHMLGNLVYNGNLSTADFTTVCAIIRETSGTP